MASLVGTLMNEHDDDDNNDFIYSDDPVSNSSQG